MLVFSRSPNKLALISEMTDELSVTRVLNFVCQKISGMAEITEFREISWNFSQNSFWTIFKILLNIFKLLFPKFSNFGGGRNHRISRNFAEILNTVFYYGNADLTNEWSIIVLQISSDNKLKNHINHVYLSGALDKGRHHTKFAPWLARDGNC